MSAGRVMLQVRWIVLYFCIWHFCFRFNSYWYKSIPLPLLLLLSTSAFASTSIYYIFTSVSASTKKYDFHFQLLLLLPNLWPLNNLPEAHAQHICISGSLSCSLISHSYISVAFFLFGQAQKKLFRKCNNQYANLWHIDQILKLRSECIL